MPELSAADMQRMRDQIRNQERANRHRKRPTYATISVAEAKREGYVPITSAYSTRQFDQCAMLDAVIKDFAQCDVKLVRIRGKNAIEVWRKKWDRHRAPKASKPAKVCYRGRQVKRLSHNAPAEELLTFLGKILGSIMP